MNLPSDGSNGRGHLPAEVLEAPSPPLAELQHVRRRPLWPALALFLLTVISTLAVGSEFALSYARGREPFSSDASLLATLRTPFAHPRLLLLGVPFSFTLLGILLAHELGHYFTCKKYGIDASYPYFLPAPTLFGTFGAFIRIRSPITTRRALFDVGISGPVVGFLLALPAMAYGVATSKIVPGAEDSAAIVFGHPPLMRLLSMAFHPHADVSSVLLNPVGRAAWVGLFATALNLLPVWQLDGGHIVFSLASAQHRWISLAVAVALVALGLWCWPGWTVLGVALTVLSLRFRHPPLADPWEPLDSRRRAWAAVALAIFLLCFTPWPAR